MKKIVLLAFVLVLLSMSMLGTRLVITVGGSTIHHVYLGDSIQDAINSAEPGDTIFVHNGTYYEHVVVNKSISLIGENRNNTIIDGNSTGNVIEVTASNVNITGFTVQKSGSYPNCGIYVGEWNSGNNISHNIITGNYYGIRLYGSSGNTVSGSDVSKNQYGIYLDYYSVYNTVCGNDVSNNDYFGIYLVDYSGDNTVSSNTVSPNNRHGIILGYSSSNVVSGNIVCSNKLGGARAGIRLESETEPAAYSSNNTFCDNTAYDNYYGISIFVSSNNVFFHNNFVDNTEQVYSYNSVNVWDDGYPSGGNYWSDYEDRYPYAEEIDDSGIWDTPYVIDENNQDNYPIVPEFPSWTSMLLILILLTVATAIYKRRLLETPIH